MHFCDIKQYGPRPKICSNLRSEMFFDGLVQLVLWHFLFVLVLTHDYSTLSCRLPNISGSDGVQIKYRPECYSQIGKLRVDACAMSQRKEQLDSLAMTDDHVLHSDVFVISKEYLSYDLINSFLILELKKKMFSMILGTVVQ